MKKRAGKPEKLARKTTKGKKGKKMIKVGKRIYFVPSLHENSISGTITKIETFKNKIVWIEMKTKDGTIIKDYAQKFTASKPRKYNGYAILNKYAYKYKRNDTKEIVSFAELEHSYFVYQAGKMSFDEYMNGLTNNGFLTPIA